jgi:hypothetical protein
MVFPYYKKLSPVQKRIYQKSDEIHTVPLPDGQALHPLISRLVSALELEDRGQTEEICKALATGLASRLGVPLLRLHVLAVRPSAGWGELHGLYELDEGRASAVISLWMRTARHRRVVAFRSFLRTFHARVLPSSGLSFVQIAGLIPYRRVLQAGVKSLPSSAAGTTTNRGMKLKSTIKK